MMRQTLKQNNQLCFYTELLTLKLVPHISQELSEFLLAFQRPKLEAACCVAGIAYALIQRPVLVQRQTKTGAER